MTLLAPEIVEAILDRRRPEGLGLRWLLQTFPTAWDDQPGVAIGRRCAQPTNHGQPSGKQAR